MPVTNDYSAAALWHRTLASYLRETIFAQYGGGIERTIEQYGISEQRGWELLYRHLDEAQQITLDKSNWFAVTGCHTGHSYRVYTGRNYNVCRMDKHGDIEVKLCFRPAEDFCTGDIMLTQKLMLELRENEALRVANQQWLKNDPGPGRRYGEITRLCGSRVHHHWTPAS
jgi:hypothetical protein